MARFGTPGQNGFRHAANAEVRVMTAADDMACNIIVTHLSATHVHGSLNGRESAIAEP